jgi:hypothetical protein
MPVTDRTGHSKVTPPFSYGMITPFSGSSAPDGWVLCDGNNDTPDMRDQFILGASAVGDGSSAGTISPTAALTHAGAAVGAHSAHAVGQPTAHGSHGITQPDAHSGHVVTQAATHATHASGGAHTHEAHATGIATAGTTTVITDNFTHSSDGAHTHDAHPAHSGAALDAHSAHTGANLDAHSAHTATALDAHSAHGVTQPSSHAVPLTYSLAYCMRVVE